MELVSVIVLGYNVDKYIGRCIESIITQTYSNIELIVIDDCSRDQTWRVINDTVRSIKSSQMKIILHKNVENSGSASSRNLGLTLASGGYFTFVDGDDWIEPYGIQKMIEKARSTKADIVMSDFIMDREGESQVDRQNILESSNIDIIKSILLGKVHGSVCNKLYNRSLVNKLGVRFIDGADYTEDLAFNVVFLTHTKNIEYNSDPYYHYCIRSDSMSRAEFTKGNEINNKDIQKIKNIKRVSEELKKAGLISLVKKELNYCKLGARMPLLDYPTKQKCKLWQSIFPESNSCIMSYDRVGCIYRIKLLLLILRLNSLFLLINNIKELVRR